MMKLSSPALLLLAAWTITASAHHAFDPLRDSEGRQSYAVVDGTVRVFRIVNPHGVLIVNVAGESGEATPWLIELNPATQLAREGWTDDIVAVQDRVSVALALSRAKNRGRLRAMLIHPSESGKAARLFVAYGIRGDTPVMQRLRERLPSCGSLNEEIGRTACFLIDADVLRKLEAEFPGPMGYVMEDSE